MVIVCDFSVTWICGALAQFTSVMVPTIEYTVDDWEEENSGGTDAGGGSVFGAAATVVVEAGFASGSVLRSIRNPESDVDFAGAGLAEPGAAEGGGGGVRTASPAPLSAVGRSLVLP